MNLADYTTQRAFLPQIKCDDLRSVVAVLADALAAEGAVADAGAFVDEVIRREEEGSTAVGGGLVIPHARSAGVKALRLGVATLAEPVDVAAADGRPADVVILLAGPDANPRRMLRVLARLARLVKRVPFLDGLRGATTTEALALAFARAEESLP